MPKVNFRTYLWYGSQKLMLNYILHNLALLLKTISYKYKDTAFTVSRFFHKRNYLLRSICLQRNTRVALKSFPFAQGSSCLIKFFNILDTQNYRFIPPITSKIAVVNVLSFFGTLHVI